jgi:hypothetical protein
MIEHLELACGPDGRWEWTISDSDGRQIDRGGGYPTRHDAVADLKRRHVGRVPRLAAIDDAKPADGPLSVDYRVEFP